MLRAKGANPNEKARSWRELSDPGMIEGRTMVALSIVHATPPNRLIVVMVM